MDFGRYSLHSGFSHSPLLLLTYYGKPGKNQFVHADGEEDYYYYYCFF